MIILLGHVRNKTPLHAKLVMYEKRMNFNQNVIMLQSYSGTYSGRGGGKMGDANSEIYR